MANALLHVDLIGRNVLARLVNSLGMLNTASRAYEGCFAPDKTYMIGSVLRIRKPVFFEATENAAVAVQDVIEQQGNITVSQQYHVDVAFTSIEESMFLQDPATNVYQGAAGVLANVLDAAIIDSAVSNIWRIVGSAGAGLTNFSIPNLAAAQNQKAAVNDSAYMCVSTKAGQELRASLYNAFNRPFNENICRKVMLGSYGDHDLFVDQNITTHTTGSFAGTPLVDSYIPGFITIKGFTHNATGVLKKGDIISFANVYAVNPVTKIQTGEEINDLAKFIVQIDYNSDGDGKITIPIFPSIYTTGPYQNVTAPPATNAIVYCFGVTNHGTPSIYTANYCYAQDAFHCVVVPGPISTGSAYSKVFMDPDTGIAIRCNITYKPETDEDVLRFDIYFGAQTNGAYATIMAS